MQKEHYDLLIRHASIVDGTNAPRFAGDIGIRGDRIVRIGALTGAFMVTGVAYAVLATPVYLANALVQVEPKKNDMLGFSDLNSMLGGQSPSVTGSACGRAKKCRSTGASSRVRARPTSRA